MQRRHVLAGPQSRSEAARPAALALQKTRARAFNPARYDCRDLDNCNSFQNSATPLAPLEKVSDFNRRHPRQAIVKDLFKFEAITFSCHRVSASPYR